MVEFDLNERLKYGDIRGHFVILAEIGGHSVTSIGPHAFSNCGELTSIEIPNSVITIDNGAFADCRRLISIEIPNSVISIGKFAFAFCIALTSIEIPYGVTSIGDLAFAHCIALTSMKIPNSVVSIVDWAFAHCSGLTSIKIHKSVSSIGIRAFEGCSELDTIKLSLPMRKLFPYKWANALNLSSTFDYIFEFLSWQDLARMTKVSKYFYSNVMVRCLKDFMYNRIGEANVVIESDRPAELCIIGSAQCMSLDRGDELALYSSDCSGVRSVCVPPSFQEAAPAVVDVRKK